MEASIFRVTTLHGNSITPYTKYHMVVEVSFKNEIILKRKKKKEIWINVQLSQTIQKIIEHGVKRWYFHATSDILFKGYSSFNQYTLQYTYQQYNLTPN